MMGDQKWQVIAPKTLREVVLRAYYGTARAELFGVSRTLRWLQQSGGHLR